VPALKFGSFRPRASFACHKVEDPYCAVAGLTLFAAAETTTEPELNSQISYAAASADFRAGRYTQSLSTLNRLLDIERDVRTYTLLAKTLIKLGLNAEAASAYELAAGLDGGQADDHLTQSMKLYFAAGQKDKALSFGNRLLKRARKDPNLAFIIASILVERNQLTLAESFKTQLIESDNNDHIRLGAHIAIRTWDLFDGGDAHTAKVLLKRVPNDNRMRLAYLLLCREHNKFDAQTKHQAIIDAAIAAGDIEFLRDDVPFFNIHWCDDERINHMARGAIVRAVAGARETRRALPHTWSDKIRIGYVSADFFDMHATMKLIRRVLEVHDRDRFEIVLFCHTDLDLLLTNEADRSLWGEVVTIRDMSSQEAVEAIRSRGIDILVDIKGHTKGNRLDIFNLGGAPIQVTWLGFPGSVGNADLDYAIGDRFVLPDSSAPFYDEKFCRLPEVYQPNDPLNRPLPQRADRSKYGLPDDAFVFASFNANRKISPAMIEAWATILKRTPGSVIWLLATRPESNAGIEKKFVECGINAKRVFFSPKMEYDYHISRIPTADLGLDTYPVNGHTTTSEQLWAGLPVVTMKGKHFASRVSESLLHSVGLDDLVADDLEAYIALAVSLYNDRARLDGMRQQLDDVRFTSPLFDAERLCRHLETGYEMMMERAKAGLEPDHIDVPALPPRDGPFMNRA
jgi:tetratricopeptide (TPR) repeat protein